MDHQWNLGLKVMYKNSIAELGNSDPLSVYESDFAQIQIQQETMNVAVYSRTSMARTPLGLWNVSRVEMYTKDAAGMAISLDLDME